MQSRFNDDEVITESSVLRSMVLLSTLSTAAEVWYVTKERRAGRDPSTLEHSCVVKPFLFETSVTLREMIFRLRANLLSCSDGRNYYVIRLVRRFDNLLILQRISRRLHLVHQRLLSLYPEVDADLIEEARILGNKSIEVVETESESELSAFVLYLDRLLDFTAEVQRNVD